MKNAKKGLIIALLASVTLTVAACHTIIITHRTANPPIAEKHCGPPPHAPAHGYRHRHADGVQLVYDANIGVYVVVGHTDVYFYKDRYYRFIDASWQVSAHVSKGWAPVSEKSVPRGLRKTHVCRKGK